MATALTPTSLDRTALVALGAPPAADVTGNTVPNGGSTFLYIENGSTPRTITVAFARGVDGVVPDAREFNIGANFKGFLRIGSVGDYGSTVTVTASHAEVLVKAFQL
jgi:hypothetical protein